MTTALAQDQRRSPEPAAKAAGSMRSRVFGPGTLDSLIFFGPIVVVLVGILAFPIAFALYASFANVDDLFSLEFVGLKNYRALLSNPESLVVPLFNTVRFVFASVAGCLILGFGGALLLNARLAGQRWMRSALMFPWVIPTVLTALLWRWIMDSNAGAFNGLLLQLGIISQPQSWLGDPALAPWIIILAQIWHGFPFVMVMLLAGLQTIPKDLYEAAAVDGAGEFRQFAEITWPGVRSIFILVGTLEGLYAFREFATIEVLTGGGPARTTEVLATEVYRLFFQFFKFGQALALAAFMFILALVFTLLFLRLSMRGESE